MAKRKTVKKTVNKAAKKGAKKGWQATVAPPVQKALQVTWLLKGAIKNEQIAYIRVCLLIEQVRREKLWAELKHPSIEDYAEKRLQLLPLPDTFQ